MAIHNNTGIEIMSMLCIIVSLYFILKQVCINRENKLWAIPMGVFLVHGLIFYIALNIKRYFGFDFGVPFMDWSIYLRLHGYTTILIIEYFRYEIQKTRLGKK